MSRRKARAQAQQAEATLATARSQLAQRQSEHAAAQAVVVQRQAELDAERTRAERIATLAQRGDMSRQAADDARAAVETRSGAGFAIVWPQFLALLVIGAALFAASLAWFRKALAQMA